MDFTFNEDRSRCATRSAASLMTEAAPEVLRDIWETDRGRSPELRAKLAEQGLTAMSVPEVHGGLDLGDIDWSLMTQELGITRYPTRCRTPRTWRRCCSGGSVRTIPWRALAATHCRRLGASRARPPGQPWVADAPPRTSYPRAGDRPGLALHALTPGTVSAVSLPSIDGSRRLAALSCTPNLARRCWRRPTHRGCGMKRWTAPPSTWPASSSAWRSACSTCRSTMWRSASSSAR